MNLHTPCHPRKLCKILWSSAIEVGGCVSDPALLFLHPIPISVLLPQLAFPLLLLTEPLASLIKALFVTQLLVDGLPVEKLALERVRQGNSGKQGAVSKERGGQRSVTSGND